MGPRSQNSLQSKYDDTAKISKSVFITNFPNDCSSKDIWKVCKDYGTVIDVFIPNKKSKVGKRFAFVRFIRVLNCDRLIANLRTIWIGSFHLFANHVRYKRSNSHSNPKETQLERFMKLVFKQPADLNQETQLERFMKPVFKQPADLNQGGSKESFPESHVQPSLVLDDACLMERDLANCVMGEVRLWVLIELKSTKSKAKLMDHVGVALWFRLLTNAQPDFVVKERIVPKQEVNSDDGSVKINDDDNNEHNGEEESDSEVVSDTFFGDNDDDQARKSDSSASIPFPPGYTPADVNTDHVNHDSPIVDPVRSSSRSPRNSSTILDKVDKGEEVFVSQEVPLNAAATTTIIATINDITLAQALEELKSVKLKAATTIRAATSRPKAKGIKAEAELTQEGSLKRTGDDLEQERSKKQEVDNDKEFEERKKCLEIIPHDGDENQQGLVKVKNWKLYDSCGVYCVIMQNILYYLLVEKMYPLTKHTLHQMFDVKLQVDYECEMAYELLRLVKK
nr:hypothetical protein [Tanacetum cinerariifolium]